MIIKTVKDIGEEPVEINEAKNYLRVDIDEDDGYITSLITSARQHIETISNISLIEKEVVIEVSPSNGVALPFEPFKEIVSVKVAGENFEHYKTHFNYEGTCAVEFLQAPSDTAEITFISGFSETPKPLWQAILLLVSHWYDNREVVTFGRYVTPIDMTLKSIIAPYKRWRT